MKSVTYLFLFTVVCFLGFSNCSKSNESNPGNCDANWALGVQSELEAVSNALIAYSTDQNSTTCNAFKVAYQDYINALKQFEDCALLTGTDRAQFEAALQEAEDELPTLCDE